MSYKIKELTIRTNNSKEGIDSVYEVWRDIALGKLPLMVLDNYHIISKYHNYDDDGYYDITIMSVDYKKFERDIDNNRYKKYESVGESIIDATNNAWNKVYKDIDKGLIKRAFTEDYECSFHSHQIVFDKDYCCLYISIL